MKLFRLLPFLLPLSILAQTSPVTINRATQTLVFPASGTLSLGSVTIAGPGGGLTVDASGFDGNLATTDNTLQEIAQKLDDLVASGSTKWNAIGDPDGDNTVALAGRLTLFTSTLDNGIVWEISDTDADAAADTTLLKLSHNDGADANVIYLSMIGDKDGTPAVDYVFTETGATFGKPLDLGINGLTADTVSASTFSGDGASITGLDAGNIATGTLAVARGGTGITSFGTGVATAFGQNVSGSGSIALTGSPTFTGTAIFEDITFASFLKSTTAAATPGALSATQFTGFASTTLGATLMGYGTTYDAALLNRAGTTVLGVTANTTGLVATGTLSVASTLIQTGNIELNHASANTLTASGGVLSIEGAALAKTTTVVRGITLGVDGAGSAVTTGLKHGVATFPVAGTITAWAIACDTGTPVVKVARVATGTAIPTTSDYISGNITLASGTYLRDTSPSGEFNVGAGTTVTANDLYMLSVISNTGSATWITLFIEITPTN